VDAAVVDAVDDQRGDEGHCVGEIPVGNRYAIAREGIYRAIKEG